MADPSRNSNRKKVLIDADAFVAFVKQDDAHHRRAREILQHLKEAAYLLLTANGVSSSAA
jgi:predicted nucleic acid-binding protein